MILSPTIVGVNGGYIMGKLRRGKHQYKIRKKIEATAEAEEINPGRARLCDWAGVQIHSETGR